MCVCVSNVSSGCISKGSAACVKSLQNALALTGSTAMGRNKRICTKRESFGKCLASAAVHGSPLVLAVSLVFKCFSCVPSEIARACACSPHAAARPSPHSCLCLVACCSRDCCACDVSMGGDVSLSARVGASYRSARARVLVERAWARSRGFHLVSTGVRAVPCINFQKAGEVPCCTPGTP